MPAYASGLSAQVMVAAESTVGTAVTPTIAYEFLEEGMQFNPTWLDGQGLKAGQAFKRVSRTVQSRFDVNGDLTVEHADQGHMGLLWKHALGSALTTPVVIATTAYKQLHTPGTHGGLGLTIQVGRPEASTTTVKPFTYNGCKVSQWDFSCNDGQLAQLKLTIDGWNEATATALATASYTAGAGVFTFADASNFKLGGTASTSGGETTITSGSAVTSIVRGVTITGATGMKVDRYGLGNSGVKKEQLENDFPTITGTLDAEFTLQSDFYTAFKANTTTAMQLDFSHGDAGSANPYLLSFIFPAVKFKSASVNATGPDVLGQQVAFEAFDDGSGTNPVLQVKLVSKDTTL